MKTPILLMVLIVFFLGCKEKTDFYATIALEDDKTQSEHPGKQLMETHCYLCHGPKENHDERLGPPMIAVKSHYIDKFETKADFVNAIQEWIKNPNIDDSRMPGAVRRFGLMPKQAFAEESIEKIADYLFETSIEEPEWFKGHMKGSKRSNDKKGNSKSKD